MVSRKSRLCFVSAIRPSIDIAVYQTTCTAATLPDVVAPFSGGRIPLPDYRSSTCRPHEPLIATLRRVVLGRPLPSSASKTERLSIPRAMGAFGLYALSSVAYGPDEILYVLLLAGVAGTRFDLPIALAIALLLGIVATSYSQTIYAYPRGGGSFTVAKENLGVDAGLAAAAALMVDYLTTVAVSVTAGVAALVAVWPALNAHRVWIDVLLIAILVFINLRGVREAGAAFVLPTYAFVG